MDGWLTVATIAGVLLITAVVIDVLLTVLHVDLDGPIAGTVQRGTWRVARAIRRLTGRDRLVLGLAGPAMIALGFLTWIALYIIGFGLLYWPRLQQLRFDEELGPPGFVDALYFSGNTATVLGFGDISPITGALKMIVIFQAGLGFALVTAVVTYMINTVAGVAERNALARRVWVETGDERDGVAGVIRSLRCEAVSDLRERLASLARELYGVAERMHELPVLVMYYRSMDRTCDPELMIKGVAGLAVASRLVAAAPAGRRLGTVADDLEHAALRLMRLVEEQYMSDDAVRRIRECRPEQRDRDALDGARHRISAAGIDLDASDAATGERALVLAARSRVFLDELDRVTDWRRSDRPARRDGAR